MHIQKILKGYFVFMLAVSALAAGGYHKDIQEYLYASAFLGTAPAISPQEVAISENIAEVPNPYFLHVEVAAGEDEYVIPGLKNQEVMRLLFQTRSAAMSLSGLRLQLQGVNADKIEAIRLVADGKMLAKGVIKGEWVRFPRLNYALDAESSGEIMVRVDLSGRSTVGDRVRFNIMSEDDISLSVGEIPYRLRGTFPLHGTYLTVVGIIQR